MKKVVLLKPEDMPQWDEFVKKHPLGWLCHLSSWKDVLEKSFPHIGGHFLTIWDTELCKITAGIPIYTVKSRLTGNRLVSVPFSSLCDPLISSTEEMMMLFPCILDIYRKEKISHTDIRSSFLNFNNLHSEFNVSSKYTHHYLKLDRTPDELKKTFHVDCVQRPLSKA